MPPPPPPPGLKKGPPRPPPGIATGAARPPPAPPRGLARGSPPARGGARGPPPAPRGMARGRPAPARGGPARGGPARGGPARGGPSKPRGAAAAAAPRPARGGLLDAIKAPRPTLKKTPTTPSSASPPGRPPPRGPTKKAPATTSAAKNNDDDDNDDGWDEKETKTKTKTSTKMKKTTATTSPNKSTPPSSLTPQMKEQKAAVERELSKIRKETKMALNEQARTEKLIQNLRKEKQREEEKRMKEAKKALDALQKQRKTLEEKVKELEKKTSTPLAAGGGGATSHEESEYADILKKTTELDNISKYYLTRISTRTSELRMMRASLQECRSIREESINRMTEEFDRKRNELASAHQDAREELVSNQHGGKYNQILARIEDQHGRMLGETSQVLKLLAARESAAPPLTAASAAGSAAAPTSTKFLRTFNVDVHLYKNCWNTSGKLEDHPSKMSGVTSMFSAIQTKVTYQGGQDDKSSVPVDAIIMELNDMAKQAPACFQELYERATSIFMSMVGNIMTRANYLLTIEKCKDAFVQGLLLSNHETTLSLMKEEAAVAAKGGVEGGGHSELSTAEASMQISAMTTNNNMFEAMISKHHETIVREMRTKYEEERTMNLNIFQNKMKAARIKSEEELGHLKYLPEKVDEARRSNERNQVRRVFCCFVVVMVIDMFSLPSLPSPHLFFCFFYFFVLFLSSFSFSFSFSLPDTDGIEQNETAL